MKIIIFGGSGFIGSHVADRCSESGHQVTIFDIKDSPYLKENQRFIKGDFLDFSKVKNAVSGQDIVFNFAGVSDIDQANKEPLDAIKINIIGCANLLEALRINSVKRYIFASTLYVYSEAGSFYRCTKQACELLTEEYQRRYKIDFTILRYGSLYGLRSDDTNWIYNILRMALREKKIIRYGDGQEIREYIHVEDAARCSLIAIADEYKNQSVIISGQQPIKVCDLLVMIKEIMGDSIKIEYRPDNTDNLHYEITPYSFKPRLAKRLFTNSYVDLGQGIIQILSDIHNNEFQLGNHRERAISAVKLKGKNKVARSAR